jgi:hypothetical protein
MKTTKENDKLLLWLSATEFSDLQSNIQPIDSFAYEPLLNRGLDSLVLDFPYFKIIAVLDPETMK